ncbi:hypothetical protein E1B28_010338 [Marasmius oreades]|uniref:FAD-binding PCMH-type domain-containing protein n=1 Tax=Marasmius oreades TaxID=181124 RepID=A0A9P7USL1_9AGAR|nr:uncharacterized protein E1B28_010338 [Marasmius oreades]KAG7091291.1 hypothetical protein E1B28_010338 [Marasmius oreades]
MLLGICKDRYIRPFNEHSYGTPLILRPPMSPVSSREALPAPLIQELADSIRGNLYSRDDSNFKEYTAMFNGNVKTRAKAVACPLDAEDVSKIVLFCVKHSLSPSVKAGGFGTAGWAVNGDMVIDLSQMLETDIEVAKEDGSYTCLRDMPTAHSKGKRTVPAGPTTVNPGKRRREADGDLRVYDSDSPSATAFLNGENIPHVVRRRTSEATYTLGISSYNVGGESHDRHSAPSVQPSRAGSHLASGRENSSTSSSPQTLRESYNAASSGAPPNADPFGYLNRSTNMDISNIQTTFARTEAYNPIGTGPSTIVANPSLPSTSRSMPSQSRAIHPFAYVTFGAGKRQKEIDIFTSRNPLPGRSVLGEDEAIPYHVPSCAHPTGSSMMILGGFGFLSRLRGLSIDNVVELEMVLADGQIAIVNENNHPDLFWAVRGAGSAFGVVTRYKVKAFPIPVVFAGNLIYRFHKSTAPSLIKHFRDCVKGAPRELYANVFLTAGPPGKDSLVVIQMCYVGPKERGQEYALAMASWEGDKCLLNEIHEKSFLHQQDSVAQVLRGKAGRQWFIRSALITSLSDEIIDKTVMKFSDTPEGCTWLFELAGGAIADFENTCLPKSQREATFTVAALHQWDMGINDPRCITTAESWIKDTLKPVQTGGPFPSFLGRHESPDRTIACYGENWDRLTEIKEKYDPTNLFRNSLWPLDRVGKTVEVGDHEPPTGSEAGTSFDCLERKKD